VSHGPPAARLDKTSEKEWSEVLAVNLTGAFLKVIAGHRRRVQGA